MANTNIETRLEVLEQQIKEISAQLSAKNGADLQSQTWTRSLGMFDDSVLMKKIDEEGRRIRQQDREQAANDHS